MTVLDLFFIMLVVFCALSFSEIFKLKKEVRKLSKIASHLLEERKNKNKEH